MVSEPLKSGASSMFKARKDGWKGGARDEEAQVGHGLDCKIGVPRTAGAPPILTRLDAKSY